MSNHWYTQLPEGIGTVVHVNNVNWYGPLAT
jgi:hypothetical protein